MYSILVAEDEDLERNALCNIIRTRCPQFTQIFEASNGLEALEVCTSQKPEIILCDIRMPGLDGLSFARQIQPSPDKQRLVFISACAEFSYAQEALRLHASDYLLKPVDDEVLVNQLERLCALIGTAPNNNKNSKNDTLEVRDQLNPRLQKLLDEAEAYMRTKLDTVLGLEETAFQVGLSPAYFSKVFHSYKGCTYVDWLNKLRIDKALELLADSHLSIKELAARCGFQEANYFARVFRIIHGKSPTEYREELFRIK